MDLQVGQPFVYAVVYEVHDARPSVVFQISVRRASLTINLPESSITSVTVATDSLLMLETVRLAMFSYLWSLQ